MEGGSALEQAAVGEHKGAMEVLLKAGANPNIADAEGDTALGAMAGVGNCEMLQLLLDAKADLQHANKDGQTGQPPQSNYPRAALSFITDFLCPGAQHSTLLPQRTRLRRSRCW